MKPPCGISQSSKIVVSQTVVHILAGIFLKEWIWEMKDVHLLIYSWDYEFIYVKSSDGRPAIKKPDYSLQIYPSNFFLNKQVISTYWFSYLVLDMERWGSCRLISSFFFFPSPVIQLCSLGNQDSRQLSSYVLSFCFVESWVMNVSSVFT